jgi:hypothetical protein
LAPLSYLNEKYFKTNKWSGKKNSLDRRFNDFKTEIPNLVTPLGNIIINSAISGRTYME